MVEADAARSVFCVAARGVRGAGLMRGCAAARMHTVFAQLIENAVKFTDTGSIEVRAEVTGGGDCQVVRVEVSDTGCGIKEEQLGSIWACFSQVTQRPRAHKRENTRD
eukprot:579495-Rhodomonas_salina.3